MCDVWQPAASPGWLHLSEGKRQYDEALTEASFSTIPNFPLASSCQGSSCLGCLVYPMSFSCRRLTGKLEDDINAMRGKITHQSASLSAAVSRDSMLKDPAVAHHWIKPRAVYRRQYLQSKIAITNTRQEKSKQIYFFTSSLIWTSWLPRYWSKVEKWKTVCSLQCTRLIRINLYENIVRQYWAWLVLFACFYVYWEQASDWWV